MGLAGISRCGGGNFSPLQGVYNAPPVSIPSGGSFDDATWTYVFGDAVLDLTTPTAPKALATGLYLFSIQWFVTGGGTAGRSFEGNFQTLAPPAHNMNSYTLNPSDGSGIGGFVSEAIVMPAGQPFRLHFGNNDTAAHNFSSNEIDVVFIAT